jgi:membrane-bound lytic murein transglycosylase D
MSRYCALIVAVLLALSALSAAADEPANTEAELFPHLEAIRPNIDFWTRVFSEWTLGQVVIHDLEYPALIYEIVELPGPIEGRYTDEQKDWVEAHRQDWERYLHSLERKVAADKPLDDIDKRWVLHIATMIGSDKLEDAHERVRSQRGLRERFREGLERSFRLDGPIREIMRAHGLPEDLAYLPHVESSFQYHARSSAGATGLWQFTRGTGKIYLTINSAIDERLDPIAATRGAARYLKDAYAKLGTWPLALTSYNHGVQGMTRAKERFGTDFEKIFREYRGRLFGFASKNFYAEFLAARRIASNADAYFPEGYAPEPELDLDSVVLDRRVTPYWLANRYGVELDELASINPAWSSRAVDKGLRLPAGTEVWLPSGTLETKARPGAAVAPAVVDGDGLYHVVRRGDTLSTIAVAHGIGLGRLRELNGMPRDAKLIHPGQKLRVGTAPAREIHVVRRGETLSEIAHANGVPLADLRRENGLGPKDNVIHPGQELQLPIGAAPRPERRHVVRRGDTLTHIATRHGVKLSDLLSTNALTMQSIILPGQTLRIP